MNILILGGTAFLGIQLVNSSLKKNHDVTIFTRGLRNPDIFPDIEKLKGDRAGDLSVLKGRKFDCVIDTSGHLPGVVRNSAELLKDNAEHYTFISSISAYKDFSENGINEEYESAELTDGNDKEMTMENYGALKALCEKAVDEVFGTRSLNIRPGLIVGENDWSDRFTYWIHRINKGGKVIAPGSGKSHTQFINVKDLADWIIKMSEEKKSGLYNATGPEHPLTLEMLFDECKKVTGSDAEIVWVNEKFVLEENVTPWMELPLWVPEDQQGVNNVDISKALNAGLKFRPLETTIKETLAYDKSRINHTFRAGLKPEREKELLNKLLAG